MSTVKWVAALALAALSASIHAEPLFLSTSISGAVTSTDNRIFELGYLQAGTPITVDFANEANFTFSAIDAGTLINQSMGEFTRFDVASGSHLAAFDRTPAWNNNPFNQIQLHDNVVNAAGEVVDGFELYLYGEMYGGYVRYSLVQRLEFSPDTFDGLDAWSVLALEHAPLLGGMMEWTREASSWDGPDVRGALSADVTGFSIQFSGPGAEVPAVPEPGQYALLLAGLAGAAALRRRPGEPRRAVAFG